MADLKIDTTAVRDLGTELASVGREFTGANAHSDRIAGAVGHSGLSDAVHDFAHEWDDTREGMVNDIVTLSKAAIAIADGFDQTDGQLAKALTDPPAPGAQHGPVAQ
ncbi:hypothetical protein OSC27_12440 [Microbacterium sp. STN6]|uniref:hypothetical protein n=1 Tax=Microbacterium sp. STN6 TaxID=2995588 RepID=UPI002260B65D|nr:hypothetical protein [Microbacterium sp. STN6]MCX7523080.1 hypothetical protein [Microbacterium sp. STN6]